MIGLLFPIALFKDHLPTRLIVLITSTGMSSHVESKLLKFCTVMNYHDIWNYSGGFCKNTLQTNLSVLESRYWTLHVTNFPFSTRSRSASVFSSYWGSSGLSTLAISIRSVLPYSSLLSLRKWVTAISKMLPERHDITGPPMPSPMLFHVPGP